MKVEMHEISLREIYNGYCDREEDGLFAYGGKLEIRPPYQREFVYDDKEKKNVIQTITRGYPLNVMYWSKNEDDSYQLLDGQQRTLSALSYINGDFSYNNKFFKNLTEDKKNEILDYKCMIYICEGTQTEKLDWFEIVNISGEPLTKQELRNSQYVGPWLYDAKKHFSKNNCPAKNIGEKYINPQLKQDRQECLELALKWICKRDNNISIEQYMGIHQFDKDANDLWQYFQTVINWANMLFPNCQKKITQGVDWGSLYHKYKDEKYNSNDLEEKVNSLISNEEVQKIKGICPYLITGDESYLNLRTFKDKQKADAYAKQEGICPVCGKHFNIEEMEADHIIPWHEGGKTIDENCQMLCMTCNRKKGGK